jgi:hypothetical protein
MSASSDSPSELTVSAPGKSVLLPILVAWADKSTCADTKLALTLTMVGDPAGRSGERQPAWSAPLKFGGERPEASASFDARDR